jgi:circadian clock protein KaiC
MRALGSTRIVLDALDLLMGIFRDPEREREELYLFHNWIKSRGFTSILTVKSGSDNSNIYPFMDFMVDCVIFLDQRMEGQVRTRRLNVVKYRGSDFMSNEHPYVMTAHGIVLMPVSSMDLEYNALKERVSSGYDKLDEILGGRLLARFGSSRCGSERIGQDVPGLLFCTGVLP